MKKRAASVLLFGSIWLSVVLWTQSDFSPAMAQTTNQAEEKSKSPSAAPKVGVEGFGFATLYWAHPQFLTANDWQMVFAGTVVKVKSEKDRISDFTRRFKTGEIKVERIFLDLPESEGAKPGDIYGSEGFDGLKRGDKVIVFIKAFYEEQFVRVDVADTNTRLGIKVKSWDDPIVAAVEKAAQCSKIIEITPQGHKKAFRVKMYDCESERNKLILEDKEIADVWRRFDPQGFQHLLEVQELRNESKPITDFDK